MSEILRIEKLTAGYDGGATVIEEIDLAVPEQSNLAILGRNGVGKTTLLATVMGLTQISAGRVMLHGKDITRLETFMRPKAGLALVPQERDIFPSLTVEENLRVSRVRPGKWNLESVYELFPRLAERRGNYGNQLSGGEQQMLAMGRALMGNPTLLLLDEPFEGLAPVLVDALVDVLSKIRREGGLALVLVEHQADLALGLTDQAVVLDRGQVMWRGDSSALIKDPDRLSSLIGLAKDSGA